MAFIPIIGAVSSGLKPVFDIIKEWLPDKDKALALITQIQMATIASRWAYPMAMISGIAIVSACLFDLVCGVIGKSTATIQYNTPAMVILLSVFVLAATGSAKLIIAVVEFLVELMRKREKQKEKR